KAHHFTEAVVQAGDVCFQSCVRRVCESAWYDHGVGGAPQDDSIAAVDDRACADGGGETEIASARGCGSAERCIAVAGDLRTACSAAKKGVRSTQVGALPCGRPDEDVGNPAPIGKAATRRVADVHVLYTVLA